MGDGGGNSEEQIRSVEEQIRRVEDEIRRVGEEIRRVEEEIRRVEEEIRALEEGIRRVDEEIRRLEEGISTVEEGIRRVEEQIDRCPDAEEKKQLRRKEEQLRRKEDHLRREKAQLRDQGAERQSAIAQLRREKAHLQGEKPQLRDKEERLRDEKSQILQGRDLGTEHEWLLQEVVVQDFASGSRAFPSCSARQRMYRPVKVEHWDVKQEIEDIVKSADKKKRAYGISVTSSTRKLPLGRRFEESIVNFLMVDFLKFMEKKQPQLKFRFSSQCTLGSIEKEKDETDKRLGERANSSSELVELYTGGPRADLVVSTQEKYALVIEVKNGGLGPVQGDPWHLHKAWTKCSCISDEGDPNCRCQVLGITRPHGEKLIRCINQLYEYMVVFKVGYGVLTDVRNWYLFKRDNAGCLKISTGIKASGEPPRVLAALSYLAHTAVGDNSEFGDPTGNGEVPIIPEYGPPEHSDESIDDESKDPSYFGPTSNNSESETRRSARTWPDGKQLALQDVSAEDLNVKEPGGILSCEGWGGYVVVGRLRGQPVALKFAYLGTERAEGLLKEVVAYTKMKKFWGVFVPRLVGHGTTNNGRIFFVATELIEGVELGQAAVTREVETAALEALDAVHACGLLHGDVSPSNIMVVWGNQPPVRILDFGFSCTTSNKKLQQVERVSLERLLTDMRK